MGGLYGETTLSGVSNEDNLRVPPRSQDGLEGFTSDNECLRGARMALRGFTSDNEAVRYRG